MSNSGPIVIYSSATRTMNHRSVRHSSPAQMIDGVDPQGIPMIEDGFYSYIYLSHVLSQYRARRNLNSAWQQQSFWNQQQDHINIAEEMDDDGIAQNGAWEAEEMDDDDGSWMYETENFQDHTEQYQIVWEDVNPNDMMETQSADFQIVDESVIVDQLDGYMLVPAGQNGANEGLPEDTILKNLRTRNYIQENILGSETHSEMCVVCQLEYEDKEQLGILECGHEYHTDCIKKWLLQKNVCPLCKQIGIAL